MILYIGASIAPQERGTPNSYNTRYLAAADHFIVPQSCDAEILIVIQTLSQIYYAAKGNHQFYCIHREVNERAHLCRAFVDISYSFQ
jgi:hypothetical protein